jgi:hypothetical protein
MIIQCGPAIPPCAAAKPPNTRVLKDCLEFGVGQ